MRARFAAILACAFMVTPAAAASLRVAYVPVIGAAPLFVLQEEGWAKAEGLELSFKRFDSGLAALGAFGSGSIDALAIGVAPVAVARAKGLDARVVSAVAQGGSAFVAGAQLAAAFATANGDVAQAFSIFANQAGRPAKLATLPPGGVPTTALKSWLFESHRTARGDVDVVALGIDAVQQAMLSGAVDGATLLEPSLTIALARDPKLKLIATATDMFRDIPGVVVAVSGAFATSHADDLDRFVGLIARATDFVVKNPAASAADAQPYLGAGLIDAATLAKALTSSAIRFDADPRAIVEPTRRLLATQTKLGDFDVAPPIEGLFDAGPSQRMLRR